MGSNGLQWAPVQGLATDPCLIDHRTDGRSMRWKARTDGRPMPTRRNAAVNRWLEGGGAAPATPPESSSASSAVARVIALPQALHSRAITHLQPTQEPGIACSRADGDDGWEPFDDAQLAKGIAAAAGWMDMAADPSLEIVGLSDEGWEEMACFEIVSDATDYVNVHATVSRSAGAVRGRILQAQAQFGLTPAALCDFEQDANRKSAQRASESPDDQSGFVGVTAGGSRFGANFRREGKQGCHHGSSTPTALEAEFYRERAEAEETVETQSTGPDASAAAAAAAATPAAPQGMSEAEVWTAVKAEGLTLVPSSTSQSGFKAVAASGRRFHATPYHKGKQHSLGRFDTALEAALAVARFLGPDISAALAAEVVAAAAATPQGMSEAEVWAAVKAEGLALVPVSTSQSGFKGVAVSGSRFQANLYHKGKQHNLGRFDTALEAALVVARFLGADASAAAVASAPAAKPPARQVSVASKKRNLTQGGVVLVDAAGAPWYEVESLLATRQPARAVERDFLVRWRGHSPEEDSWEPESNIDDRLVQAFDSGHWAGAKAPRRVAAGASTSGAALPEADDATTSAHKRSMARMSHTEAAVAMAETHRAVATKAAMEAADEEGPGGGFARCCILGCTEQLLQCNGLKHAGCAVGRAESWHVLCAPCLGRWYTSQAGLRDEFGLLKQTRRTCPVCQAELRTTGSEMRGVAGQYAMGSQKVAGTWPEVQKKRRREAATAAAIGPDGNTDDDGVEAEEEGMFDAE